MNRTAPKRPAVNKITQKNAKPTMRTTTTKRSSARSTRSRTLSTTRTSTPFRPQRQLRSFTTTTSGPTHEEIIQGQKPVNLNFRKYPSATTPNPTLPPLVILHGLLGHANNWANIASRADLRDNRDIYTLDLRNHGLSPHTPYTDYVAMANDVSQFIEKNCSGGLATVIGHSMGGKTVAALGLLHPHNVTGLVIVDILPVSYPEKSMEEIHSILSAVSEVDFSNNVNRREVEQQLKEGGIEDVGIRQWLLTNIISIDQNNPVEAENAKKINQVVKWKPNVKGLKANYHNIRGFDLNQDYVFPFHGPSHLILGGKSSFGNRDSALNYMHENNFPECTLSVIEGAGHWCHAEKPNDFTAQLSDFLQKNAL